MIGVVLQLVVWSLLLGTVFLFIRGLYRWGSK